MSESQRRAPRPAPAGLVLRQMKGIMRLELKRSFLGRRAVGLYFLAFAPVVIMSFWAVWGLAQGKVEFASLQDATFGFFAPFFSLYLRVSIYLSALLLFMSLFRSEILERSLHYYLLTPVRRDVLVAGKYLSALVAASATFLVSTTALYLLLCLPWGGSEMGRFFFHGPGLSNLFAYVATALLGVAGYGAVFLVVGLYFKNPVIPGLLVWIWEAAVPILPALAKKVSVIFYLQSLYPVPVEEGGCSQVYQFLRVLTEPPPAWISVPGFFLFTAAVFFAAVWRARRLEISYTSE